VFGTPRLSARPFRAADEADVFAMWSDPAVGRFTGDAPPHDRGGVRADIARWRAVSLPGPGRGFWAVTTHDGRFVGDAYVRPVPGHAEHEIGWHLARPCWGRGLATELAAGLLAHAHRRGVGRLVALVHPEHAASRRVAEKAGMTFEGLSDRHDPGEPPVAVYRDGSSPGTRSPCSTAPGSGRACSRR
jgi:RimJ/RimL family protein N-acetyltransferase